MLVVQEDLFPDEPLYHSRTLLRVGIEVRGRTEEELFPRAISVDANRGVVAVEKPAGQGRAHDTREIVVEELAIPLLGGAELFFRAAAIRDVERENELRVATSEYQRMGCDLDFDDRTILLSMLPDTGLSELLGLRGEQTGEPPELPVRANARIVMPRNSSRVYP